MTTFVVLRHPVTSLVTIFTNPDNLTSDLLILKLFIINKSDDAIRYEIYHVPIAYVHELSVIIKIKQVFFIFNSKELFVNR